VNFFFEKEKVVKFTVEKKNSKIFPIFLTKRKKKKKTTRTWWSHKLKFKSILYTNFLRDYFFRKFQVLGLLLIYANPAVWFCVSLHGFQFLVSMWVMVSVVLSSSSSIGCRLAEVWWWPAYYSWKHPAGFRVYSSYDAQFETERGCSHDTQYELEISKVVVGAHLLKSDEHP
jgi:hypothetical protein